MKVSAFPCLPQPPDLRTRDWRGGKGDAVSTANALLSRVLFSSSVQSLQPLSHCNAGLWSMRSSFSSSFEKQLNIELQQSLLILPQNRIPSHSSISPGHILKTKKKKSNPAAFSLAAARMAYKRKNLTLMFFIHTAVCMDILL